MLELPKKVQDRCDVVSPESEVPSRLRDDVKLSELAADYGFFTPAWVVTYGGFDRDPLAEFSRYYPRAEADLRIRTIRLSQPILSRVPPWTVPDRGIQLDLNRTVFAIPKPRLAELELFFRLLRWVDLQTGVVASCLWQQFDLPDAVALRRGGQVDTVPTFPVIVVGVRFGESFEVRSRRVGDSLTAEFVKGVPDARRGFSPFPDEIRHVRGPDVPLEPGVPEADA